MIEPGPRTVRVTYPDEDTGITFDIDLWDEGEHFLMSWEFVKGADHAEADEYANGCITNFMSEHAPKGAVISLVECNVPPQYWNGEEFRRATIRDVWKVAPDYDLDRVMEIASIGFEESDLHAYLGIVNWSKAQAWADWETVNDEKKWRVMIEERKAGMAAARALLGRFAP